MVGYWPGTLLKDLRHSVTAVQWGGEVYSPKVRNKPHSETSMGSGEWTIPCRSSILSCSSSSRMNVIKVLFYIYLPRKKRWSHIYTLECLARMFNVLNLIVYNHIFTLLRRSTSDNVIFFLGTFMGLVNGRAMTRSLSPTSKMTVL